jgi:hypothetical protein
MYLLVIYISSSFRSEEDVFDGLHEIIKPITANNKRFFMLMSLINFHHKIIGRARNEFLFTMLVA